MCCVFIFSLSVSDYFRYSLRADWVLNDAEIEINRIGDSQRPAFACSAHAAALVPTI
jgi:hypothetical protein